MTPNKTPTQRDEDLREAWEGVFSAHEISAIDAALTEVSSIPVSKYRQQEIVRVAFSPGQGRKRERVFPLFPPNFSLLSFSTGFVTALLSVTLVGSWSIPFWSTPEDTTSAIVAFSSLSLEDSVEQELSSGVVLSQDALRPISERLSTIRVLKSRLNEENRQVLVNFALTSSEQEDEARKPAARVKGITNSIARERMKLWGELRRNLPKESFGRIVSQSVKGNPEGERNERGRNPAVRQRIRERLKERFRARQEGNERGESRSNEDVQSIPRSKVNTL